MPRGFKRDELSTRKMYELKAFRDKKKRSFISLPKPTPHGEVHELLAGIDRSNRRIEIYELEEGTCFYCKGPADLSGDMCHVEHGAGKKCDCLGNVHWGHHSCHMKTDHPERM
jgi:hypothetical protein